MNEPTRFGVFLMRGNWFQRAGKIFLFSVVNGMAALYALVFVISGFDVRALGVVDWVAGGKVVLIMAAIAAIFGAFELKLPQK